MSQVNERQRRWAACVAALLILPCCAGTVAAGSLTVNLTGAGLPLQNAVVSLHSAKAPAVMRLAPREMDQRELNFQPHVLAVQAGTEVRFPNSDNTRHQVYSFSAAKTFELPLYSGTKAKPIVLDTPGVVELGCNIHDWMLGYIVVLDTPYFAVTDASGKVTLQVPEGEYRLDVWHELQLAPTPRGTSQRVSVTSGKTSMTVDIRKKPAPVRQQPVDDRLQDLQRKFRNLKRGK